MTIPARSTDFLRQTRTQGSQITHSWTTHGQDADTHTHATCTGTLDSSEREMTRVDGSAQRSVILLNQKTSI